MEMIGTYFDILMAKYASFIYIYIYISVFNKCLKLHSRVRSKTISLHKNENLGFRSAKVTGVERVFTAQLQVTVRIVVQPLLASSATSLH